MEWIYGGLLGALGSDAVPRSTITRNGWRAGEGLGHIAVRPPPPTGGPAQGFKERGGGDDE